MIRETKPAEIGQILELYRQAFPEEDLRPVVSAVLGNGLQSLSLAAFDGDELVAHVLFTACGTRKEDRTGALLAPLGVKPSHQRQGLGDALVRVGLEILEKKGIGQVFVLGDPAYYQRFGFVQERRVLTPYPIPDEWMSAWQSTVLISGAPMAGGRLFLPEPWMNASLWQP